MIEIIIIVFLAIFSGFLGFKLGQHEGRLNRLERQIKANTKKIEETLGVFLNHLTKDHYGKKKR